MKILNLYCGIGGNRKLWGNEHEITSVEIDEKIAEVYKCIYPNDTVLIGDALKYLEEHYKEFDFIWASPPCQTHSQYRHNVGVLGKGFKPVIPLMDLYGIIIFLQTYYNGFWVVENVVPYYRYLIEPSVVLQRHPFWSNFLINDIQIKKDNIREKNKISDFADGEILLKSNISNKRQVLRNCVNSELGKHILDCCVFA